MTTLLESKAKPFGSRKGAMLSVALHAALIGGAVVGTGRAMLPPREKVEEHPVLYVATPPPPKVYVAPEPLPEVKQPPKTPRVAPPRAKAPPPPPRRAPTPPTPTPQRAAPTPQAVTAPIIAPIRVPTSIPAVDLKAIPTVSDVVASIPAPDPGKVVAAARGGSRNSSDGDVDGGRSGGTKGGLGSGDAGRAYNENQVDRAVSVTRAVVPRYPDALRSVSVQGEVMVRYIVDARGRVERGSIQILSSTHKLFADAVRAALLETRFRPAEAGGQAVRQLVEQPFVFKLDR